MNSIPSATVGLNRYPMAPAIDTLVPSTMFVAAETVALAMPPLVDCAQAGAPWAMPSNDSVAAAITRNDVIRDQRAARS